MRKFFYNLSLRKKLIILFILVGLIPLLIGEVISIATMTTSHDTHKSKSLDFLTRKVAERVDLYFEKNLRILQSEASLPSFEKFLFDRENKEISAKDETIISLLKALRKKGESHIRSYALLNKKGVNIADSNTDHIGNDESDALHFKSIIHDGNLSHIQLDTSEQPGKAKLLFSVPVRNHFHEVVGVLRVQYSAEVLQKLLLQSVQMFYGNPIGMIVNEKGLSLSHTALPNEIYNRIRPDDKTENLSDLHGLLNRSDLQSQTPLQNDFRYYVSTAGLKSQPWRVVFATPLTEKAPYLINRGKNILILVLIIVILAVFAALFIADYLARPIQYLTCVTNEIGAGNHKKRIVPPDNDEISSLAKSLNKMVINLTGTIASLRETITRYQEQGRNLKKTNRSLSTMIANLPGMAYQYGRDDIRPRKLINNGSVKITGYSADDLIRKRGFPHYDLIHPCDVEKYWGVVNNALKKNAPFQVEYRIRMANGCVKWVWEHGIGTVTPEGIFSGVEGFLVDITLRKQYKEKIAQLSRVVQQSPSSIAIINRELVIEYVNSKYQEISEKSFKHLKGTIPQVLQEGFFSNERREEILRTIKNRDEWGGEFQDSREGSLYWGQLSVFPVFDDDGKLINYTLLEKDITELKKRENELKEARDIAEQANHAKNNFLATMSHELRTPLSGVLGMAEVLQATNLAQEQVEYTKTIVNSSRALLAILNDILDFSRIESNKVVVNQEKFDLHIVIEEMIQLFQASADSKKIKLSYQLPTTLRDDLIGDTSLLNQILSNLLGNAIKFTESGSIHLDISIAEERAQDITFHFRVSDTGIGIHREMIDRIFNPFLQEDGSMTRKFGGTGLGLAIVQRLVRLMNGVIDVRSVPGQGSTFKVDLTFRKAGYRGLFSTLLPTNYKEGEAIALSHLKEPTGNLLVIEDENINQILLHGTLRKFGYSIDIVSDETEAMDILNSNTYDLILMDCLMPDTKGFRMAQTIRKWENWKWQREIPIIALTSKTMSEECKKALATDIDDYLIKPVMAMDLKDLLDKYLL